MDHSVPKTCNVVKNNFLNVFSVSPRVCQHEDAATTAPKPPATQTAKKGREKARKLTAESLPTSGQQSRLASGVGLSIEGA
jgi:hypothetical protein